MGEHSDEASALELLAAKLLYNVVFQKDMAGDEVLVDMWIDQILEVSGYQERHPIQRLSDHDAD